MASRALFTAARASVRAMPRATPARTMATSAGALPHAAPKQTMFTNIPAEVYPLLAIVVLATSGGTYMALHKIISDQDLRLVPTVVNAGEHEPLDLQKSRFGVQAGGQTYKDSQGWTRIKVKQEKPEA